ncbi:MAG: SAM-dependent methyltransferase [Clostridiales bacterium]|nr:RsmB/NOP family class I SAM-dependent RNA methyltransferase [Bacillota bacterium]NLK03540.1 SAM-dependent methyltransferase [Clostridiales bacterium]
MNLPKQFEDRMKRLLGDEYKAFLECYNKPYQGGLRVNTLKLSPEEFESLCPFSIKKIPWIYNGYYYESNEQPARHPYYNAGLYYIQEPSAMTPASLLPIEPGDMVLDLCAAPGGKSTELGARLKGEGMLVSNDISNSRAKALLKNIELFGIKNSLILSEPPDRLVGCFTEAFDKILVDAPCSGEGMFRKKPSMVNSWNQEGVENFKNLQIKILLQAVKMLKPGGMMLYSTCTFSPEENEGTISSILKECPDIHVVEALPSIEERNRLGISYEGFDCGKPEWVDGPDELRHCIRIWPHKLAGEGHFIALLRKDDISDSTLIQTNVNDKAKGYGGNKKNTTSSKKEKSSLSDEAREFLKRLKPFKELDDLENRGRILIQKDKVYLVPDSYEDNNGLRTLRQGLLLGEMKKNRFLPCQALANALKPDDFDSVLNYSSDNPDIIRYLKCETLTTDVDNKHGWQLVSVDDFPLGWGKLSNNILKNMYLPGWRWL